MELHGLEKRDVEDVSKILKKFNEDRSQAMRFDLTLNQRRGVWAGMLNILTDTQKAQAHSEALVCCRLLSRDKSGLNEAVTEDMVTALMQLSGLGSPAQLVKDEEGKETLSFHNDAKDEKVSLEAAKVLSNLIHQSPVVQSYCSTNGFLSRILIKIQQHPGLGIQDHNIKVFDFRLLFLFTALCPEQRDIAKHNHDGVSILRESIEKGMLEQKAFQDDPSLDIQECAVVCEILKVIFNLTVNCKTEDTAELQRVAATINRLLRITIRDEESRSKLVSNCVNVVTNMEAKKEAFEELVKPTDIQLPAEPDIMAEGGMVVNTAQAFVDLLERKMISTGPGSTLKEDITPVLSVLYNFAKALRSVRKYLKAAILPPLQASDLKAKPEDGNTLKSRLVSLLTNTSGDISTMVAELLFVLCKENVGRLIKHTGYGNAAGLLARRGLMAGGRGAATDYSSEEEESDSEEYRAGRDKVNPVTGCEEKKGPSPFEGMSEEQKEHEAIKLVNLMDKMMGAGVIQPCTVGADGRPEAVQHVLQLQDKPLTDRIYP